VVKGLMFVEPTPIEMNRIITTIGMHISIIVLNFNRFLTLNSFLSAFATQFDKFRILKYKTSDQVLSHLYSG
jgi:hypothetical protein